jgi:hypothetical protein
MLMIIGLAQLGHPGIAGEEVAGEIFIGNLCAFP